MSSSSFSQEDKLEELYSKYDNKGFHNVVKVSETLSKSFESIEILVDGELQKVYFRTNNRDALTQQIRDGKKDFKKKKRQQEQVTLISIAGLFFFLFQRSCSKSTAIPRRREFVTSWTWEWGYKTSSSS